MVGIKPLRNHKAIGEISEAYIIARLIEIGYEVLIPYGDNLRYDLVIEDANGKLWRVQCKTGWMGHNNSYIEFATASSYYHTRAGRTNYSQRDYQGQIDYFAVYCATTGKIYFVPIENVGKTRAMLRLQPTKNNQEKGVRWAKDYEL